MEEAEEGEAAKDTQVKAEEAAQLDRKAEEERRTVARRPALLLSTAAACGAATAHGDVASAEDVASDWQIVRTRGSKGLREYAFEQPPGFERKINAADPSGQLLRFKEMAEVAVLSRAEFRPNASKEFTPKAFIAEYKKKYNTETGAEFAVLKGEDAQPTRIDDTLGTIYYQVEYTVRSQMGFTSDTIRTDHFITTFVCAPDSFYFLNCVAPDAEWEKYGPMLRRVSDSFAILT